MVIDCYQCVQQLATQLRSDFFNSRSYLVAAFVMLLLVMACDLFQYRLDSFWLVCFIYLAAFFLIVCSLGALSTLVLARARETLLVCAYLLLLQQFFLQFVLCAARLRVCRVVQSRVLPPPLAPASFLV